jgi:hypothetical protein
MVSRDPHAGPLLGKDNAPRSFRVRTHKDSLVRGFVIHGLRQEAFHESRLFLADG